MQETKESDTNTPTCVSLTRYESKFKELKDWQSFKDELEEKRVTVRLLNETDFKRGYFDLMGQLTRVGQASEDDFKRVFFKMRTVNMASSHDLYSIIVMEDCETEKIVASTTLLLEHDCFRSQFLQGRIEDVVVSESHRKVKLGTLLIKIVIAIGREILQVPDIILDCSDPLIKFYDRLGFDNTTPLLFKKF